MQSPTVQHNYDGTAALNLAALCPPRTFTFYSALAIAAGVPVDLDLATTADLSSRPIGIGMAIKTAALGGRAIGATTKAVEAGGWVEVQVAGVQTGVVVGATVAAGDSLGVGAAGTMDVRGRRVARGVIANAALKTLNATPVSVIAAPGAGKYVRVIRTHWFLDYGTVAFEAAAAGDTLGLKYTNGSGAQLADVVAGNAIGAAAADYHADVAGIEVVPVANAAVVAHIDAGEWGANGDSVLRYEIEYEIVDLDFSANPTYTSAQQGPPTARALTAYSGGTATVLWQTGLGLA